MHLLDPQVEPFRRRNPGTTRTLTSPYAPAVGASLAGLALGVYPSQQLRVSVAIYAMFRALEFGWNMCEGDGMIWGLGKNGRAKERPWWFGSWLLQPLAMGQLMHAGVFDADCLSLPKVCAQEQCCLTQEVQSRVNTLTGIWRPSARKDVRLCHSSASRLASSPSMA